MVEQSSYQWSPCGSHPTDAVGEGGSVPSAKTTLSAEKATRKYPMVFIVTELSCVVRVRRSAQETIEHASTTMVLEAFLYLDFQCQNAYVEHSIRTYCSPGPSLLASRSENTFRSRDMGPLGPISLPPTSTSAVQALHKQVFLFSHLMMMGST